MIYFGLCDIINMTKFVLAEKQFKISYMYLKEGFLHEDFIYRGRYKKRSEQNIY